MSQLYSNLKREVWLCIPFYRCGKLGHRVIYTCPRSQTHQVVEPEFEHWEVWLRTRLQSPSSIVSPSAHMVWCILPSTLSYVYKNPMSDELWRWRMNLVYLPVMSLPVPQCHWNYHFPLVRSTESWIWLSSVFIRCDFAVCEVILFHQGWLKLEISGKKAASPPGWGSSAVKGPLQHVVVQECVMAGALLSPLSSTSTQCDSHQCLPCPECCLLHTSPQPCASWALLFWSYHSCQGYPHLTKRSPRELDSLQHAVFLLS